MDKIKREFEELLRMVVERIQGHKGVVGDGSKVEEHNGKKTLLNTKVQ